MRRAEKESRPMTKRDGPLRGLLEAEFEVWRLAQKAVEAEQKAQVDRAEVAFSTVLDALWASRSQCVFNPSTCAFIWRSHVRQPESLLSTYRAEGYVGAFHHPTIECRTIKPDNSVEALVGCCQISLELHLERGRGDAVSALQELHRVDLHNAFKGFDHPILDEATHTLRAFVVEEKARLIQLLERSVQQHEQMMAALDEQIAEQTAKAKASNPRGR